MSNPTPHDIKCQPISQAMLTNYQNKRSRPTSTTQVTQNAATGSGSECVGVGFHDGFSNEDEEEEGEEGEEEEVCRPRLQMLETRNKRKENLPVRSNENSDDVDDGFHSSNNLVASNEDDNNDSMPGDDMDEEVEQEFEPGDEEQNDEDTFYENEFVDCETGEDGNEEVDFIGEEADLEETDEYDLADCSFSPQSFPRVLSQFNDLKRKYRISSAKLKRLVDYFRFSLSDRKFDDGCLIRSEQSSHHRLHLYLFKSSCGTFRDEITIGFVRTQ